MKRALAWAGVLAAAGVLGVVAGAWLQSRHAPTDSAAWRGSGADITGSVVTVDEQGGLVTNIPFQWIAAAPTDNGPREWDKRQPSEGYHLKITIGSREYEGEFACWDGGFGETPWGVHATLVKEQALRVDYNGGSAATESGASVGARVRLVKVGEPY